MWAKISTPIRIISPGVNITNDFSIAIQIQWRWQLSQYVRFITKYFFSFFAYMRHFQRDSGRLVRLYYYLNPVVLMLWKLQIHVHIICLQSTTFGRLTFRTSSNKNRIMINDASYDLIMAATYISFSFDVVIDDIRKLIPFSLWPRQKSSCKEIWYFNGSIMYFHGNF